MSVWENPNKGKSQQVEVWVNPNKGQPKAKPTLKDVFKMAYGPEARQFRHDVEAQARKDVPFVAANIGLGAIQEVADLPPNILSTFGINVPRGTITDFAPEIENKEIAQGIGRSIPHVYGVTKGMQALNKAPYINPKNAIGGYLADIAKIGGLEYLLAPPERKVESGLGAGLATAALSPILYGLSRIGAQSKGNIFKRQLAEATEKEAALQTSKAAQEEALRQAEIQGAQTLGVGSMQHQRNIESLQANIKHQLPDTPIQNLEDLTKALKGAKSDITDTYSKMYQGFAKSDAGKKSIVEPIAYKDIEGLALKDAPPELKANIEKHIGSKQVEKARSDIIQGYIPEKTNYIGGSANVQDYLNMSKQARDEAFKYRNMAKNRNATISEKERYTKAANKYSALQKMLDEKITGSLSAEEAAQYQGIQDFFKKYEIPFREKSLYKKGVAQRPTVKTSDFYESMVKENEPALMERLLTKHPDVQSAIAKHDLRNSDISTVKSIDKLLSGQRANALPKQLKNDLESLKNELHQKELFDKLLPEVGKKELAFVKKYPEMDKIFKQKPELRKPFDDIHQESKRLKEIQAELQAAGIERKEAEKVLREYRESIRGLGSLLSIMFGSKLYYGSKAVSSLSDIKR